MYWENTRTPTPGWSLWMAWAARQPLVGVGQRHAHVDDGHVGLVLLDGLPQRLGIGHHGNHVVTAAGQGRRAARRRRHRSHRLRGPSLYGLGGVRAAIEEGRCHQTTTARTKRRPRLWRRPSCCMEIYVCELLPRPSCCQHGSQPIAAGPRRNVNLKARWNVRKSRAPLIARAARRGSPISGRLPRAPSGCCQPPAWGFYFAEPIAAGPAPCQLCRDTLRDWFVLKFRCAPNEKHSIAASPTRFEDLFDFTGMFRTLKENRNL